MHEPPKNGNAEYAEKNDITGPLRLSGNEQTGKDDFLHDRNGNITPSQAGGLAKNDAISVDYGPVDNNNEYHEKVERQRGAPS